MTLDHWMHTCMAYGARDDEPPPDKDAAEVNKTLGSLTSPGMSLSVADVHRLITQVVQTTLESVDTDRESV